MAVIRIHKTQDYTVMSNHHLKNKELSLKSKGLLSMILSLPDGWNYTTRGLASICKEGVDSIGTALKELENAGYIQRNLLRDNKGKITDTEYVIFETPQPKPEQEQPDMEPPNTALPCTDYPHTENPYMDMPCTENTAQLNTNILNKKELNTDLSNTYPIKSYQNKAEPQETDGSGQLQPLGDGHASLPCGKFSHGRCSPNQRFGQHSIGYDEANTYRDLIKENIEYDILSVNLGTRAAMLDEIVELLTETVCTAKSSLTIAGDTYPAAIVKSKLLKLNSQHIEYVIDCMKANTTDVRNIKKYLLAALFNAPSTMGSYYTAKVNHDLYGG